MAAGLAVGGHQSRRTVRGFRLRIGDPGLPCHLHDGTLIVGRLNAASDGQVELAGDSGDRGDVYPVGPPAKGARPTQGVPGCARGRALTRQPRMLEHSYRKPQDRVSIEGFRYAPPWVYRDRDTRRALTCWASPQLARERCSGPW